MHHAHVRLEGPRTWARLAATLHAKALDLQHLHVEGDEACVLVRDGERLAAVLERIVDAEVTAGGRCLQPQVRLVVARRPSAVATTPHPWAARAV